MVMIEQLVKRSGRGGYATGRTISPSKPPAAYAALAYLELAVLGGTLQL